MGLCPMQNCSSLSRNILKKVTCVSNFSRIILGKEEHGLIVQKQDPEMVFNSKGSDLFAKCKLCRNQ